MVELAGEAGDLAKRFIGLAYRDNVDALRGDLIKLVIGMLPMALSNSQNAPLGRAVMGGLMIATISTLLFVPAVFMLVHGGFLHKTSETGAA